MASSSPPSGFVDPERHKRARNPVKQLMGPAANGRNCRAHFSERIGLDYAYPLSYVHWGPGFSWAGHTLCVRGCTQDTLQGQNVIAKPRNQRNWKHKPACAGKHGANRVPSSAEPFSGSLPGARITGCDGCNIHSRK